MVVVSGLHAAAGCGCADDHLAEVARQYVAGVT